MEKERKSMKKRLKGLISVFFFLLCIFAWKSVQEVRAAENVIRDFSRIFYIPAGAVLKGGSLQKLQEIYDGMSCIAYTEDGEEKRTSTTTGWIWPVIASKIQIDENCAIAFFNNQKKCHAFSL